MKKNGKLRADKNVIDNPGFDVHISDDPDEGEIVSDNEEIERQLADLLQKWSKGNFSFFDFDRNTLWDEWFTHTRKYFALAYMLELRKSNVSWCERQVELAEADADHEIRKEAAARDEKLTEAMVKAAVVRHKLVKRAARKYLEAKQQEGVVSRAVSAMEHKRRAMEKVTELTIHGLYAQPRASGDSKEYVEEMATERAFRGGGGRREKLC